MKVIIVKNYEEASQEAAKIFINQVKENPQSILGLATGSTPIRMYELLSCLLYTSPSPRDRG